MSATKTERQSPAGSLDGFTPVQMTALRCLGTSSVDLFVVHDVADGPMLYRRAGYPVTDDQFRELEAAGLQQFYVRRGDFHLLSADLLDSLEVFLQQESIPPSHRFGALQLIVSCEIEHTLRLVDCGKYVALADRIGRQLTSFMLSSNTLPGDMFRMARHDFFTFTHVTNVSCYSVLLAERLGIRDEEQLRLIATGGMLHDIGKRFIPAKILTKPSQLTRVERELVEDHPRRGYLELYNRPGLTSGQLMMVYQHHERFNGSGFPVGILAEEMHDWSKLLAVVDVFDAMTGKRHYRRPASAQAALEYLQARAGTHFDPEVVQCWVAAMAEA